MKKILIVATAAAALFATSAFASTQLTTKKAQFFAPTSWFSSNSSDMVQIQYDIDSPNMSEKVFINVNNGSYNNMTATGINISGCGNVKHVNANASVVCTLTQANPVISFSADKTDANFVAFGGYQVD